MKKKKKIRRHLTDKVHWHYVYWANNEFAPFDSEYWLLKDYWHDQSSLCRTYMCCLLGLKRIIRQWM